MINGFDSYKLSINNLNDINADTIISNTDKTTSLYINNQFIDFSSYITSSYLSTTLSNYITSSYLSTTLSSYVLSSNLTTILTSYVTNSALSSTLNNYATTNALSSYRLISDSFNKADVTNEVIIRTGTYPNNNDGSIQTCKQYVDSATAGLSAGLAVNSTAIAGLVASLATTNATVAIIQGQVTTIQGQVSTLEADVTTLQNKTTLIQSDGLTQVTIQGDLNIGAVTPKVVINGTTGTMTINNLITLANTGVITCDTINVTTGTISQITTNVNYDQYIYSNSSVTIGNTAPYTGISSIYLNGLVYVNGVLLVPFSPASSFFSQW